MGKAAGLDNLLYSGDAGEPRQHLVLLHQLLPSGILCPSSWLHRQLQTKCEQGGLDLRSWESAKGHRYSGWAPPHTWLVPAPAYASDCCCRSCWKPAGRDQASTHIWLIASRSCCCSRCRPASRGNPPTPNPELGLSPLAPAAFSCFADLALTSRNKP